MTSRWYREQSLYRRLFFGPKNTKHKSGLKEFEVFFCYTFFMVDITPVEQTVQAEPQKSAPAKAVEQKPNATPLKEIKAPRNAIFGSIEVKENLDSDLLTRDEKVLYRGGFEMLKDVTAAADNNIERMVLTTPDVVSAIVGLQPLVSMDTGEAGLVYQAYRKAGIDFNQDYSFLEFGKERGYLKMMVNNRAAELVLRTNQKELGIELPNRRLSNDEVTNQITSLLGNPDAKKANLAHGLLSGFPLDDCKYAVEGGRSFSTIPPLKKVEGLDARFGDQTITGKDGKKITGRWDPIPNLNPNAYSMEGTRNHFLPDARANVVGGVQTGTVEGFGLRWAAPFPPRESTTNHCQKILQVDREIGLLNFVNKQRSGFSIEDGMKGIGKAREIMGKPGAGLKLPPVVAGPLGALVGIFQVFDSIKRAVEPPKPKQQTPAQNPARL